MDEKSIEFGVAIIGSGFGVKEILPAISEIPNIVLFLKKPNQTNSSPRSGHPHLKFNIKSLRKILDDSTIKLIVLAVPPKLQKKFVEVIAKSGKSIYLEKPAGLNSRETLEMANLASRFKSKIYLGFQFRFDPGILFLSNEIISGAQRTQIDSEIEVKWKIRKQSQVNNWKTNPSEGGGLHRDYLCHIVDYTLNSLTENKNHVFNFSEMQIATEDLISYLKIEYRNIKIEIERNCDLDSQWQIIYRNPDRSLELISKFPFSIRDYKFFRNGLEEIVTVETLRKGLPNPEISRNTNDARRIALQQYFQLIIADIRSESYSNEHPSELAEIRDAMVTQCIADFIQFKRRTD